MKPREYDVAAQKAQMERRAKEQSDHVITTAKKAIGARSAIGAVGEVVRGAVTRPDPDRPGIADVVGGIEAASASPWSTRVGKSPGFRDLRTTYEPVAPVTQKTALPASDLRTPLQRLRDELAAEQTRRTADEAARKRAEDQARKAADEARRKATGEYIDG